MNKNRDDSIEYDTILDAFSEPVIIFDAGSLITKVNSVALDFLQFNPIGKNISKLLEEFSPELAGVSASLLKGDNIKDKVYRIRKKDGTEEFYTFTGSLIRKRESLAGAVLIWHDQTAGKIKEHQLEKFNKNLQALVNTLSERQKIADKQIKNNQAVLDDKNSQIMVSNKLLEIIFLNTHFLIAYLTPQFVFIQVNDAYAKAFKQKPDFFINKNYFDLFAHVGNKAIFEDAIKTGDSYITYADSFMHSDKSDPGITYWDWSLQPVKNRHEVEGIILVLIDVTRRKKAEDDLFNAKRLSDIGTLAATVAHELRNPLGVIQAAIYNIKRKRRNQEIDKHLENIAAVIEESEQIINNLLSYSKFKMPARTEIEIVNFLDELFSDIRSKNVYENIVFITKYETLRKVVVFIDPVQIREVINNIVNNAYQSLPESGGQIEIQGRLLNDNRLELRIADNGDGIEKEALGRIFDPFFTCRSRGTGLGLTICKELIKLHEGAIEIQSRKGQGTTVIIYLSLKGIE